MENFLQNFSKEKHEKMKVETIYDKGVGKVNEDSLLTANPIFGVFDGASGLEPYMDDQGRTGALIASSLAKEVFASSDVNLLDSVVQANQAIRQAMLDANVDVSRKTALWATTGAVVKLNEDSFDWVQIGDSVVLTILKDGSFELPGGYLDHDLETMKMWHELALKNTENIRGILNDQILKVRNQANIKYSVLNGEPEVKDLLKHGTTSLKDVAHILLFTDGLFIPTSDPQNSDFKGLVELFIAKGLKAVQDYVRQKEEEDPNCLKYPRFKKHDDVAAIALSF